MIGSKNIRIYDCNRGRDWSNSPIAEPEREKGFLPSRERGDGTSTSLPLPTTTTTMKRKHVPRQKEDDCGTDDPRRIETERHREQKRIERQRNTERMRDRWGKRENGRGVEKAEEERCRCGKI